MDPLKPTDPRALGGIELHGVLGEGGMGKVYYGVTPDAVRVAVKVIHAHLADRRDIRARIAANHNAYGYGQTKAHYVQFVKHLDDPLSVAPPGGYEAPFYKADRESEYRQAHAVFSERLRHAKEGGR
ncbi:hypothetical protein [Actinoallomurus sp. NPDC052274]|uniref:hypothetical protein n=1 Tax=Actinoallomurus sp. NPDC052274 TaxID=3155420 RepID=UPI003423B870